MLNWIMPADFLAHNQFNTSIWGDEGFSAILSMKTLPEIIKIIINDTSPPLWNISEWIVFNTLGTAEVYIRGLALLFFVLTIVFTYKIGRMLFTKKTGLMAATLTALNPFFFIYAFEGRMYSILALGVTASMYFFLKLQRPKENRKYAMCGYVIATTWALYSHHFAIFALFVQGLWFLIELARGKRKKAKRLFKAFAIVGLLYLPWVWPLYNQASKVSGGFWLATPTLYDLKILIYDYLAQGIKTDSVKLPIIDYPIWETSLYVVFAALLMRRWHKSIKKTFFLITWFLGPILMTWVISQYFTSIFFNRYLLYTIPAAMLILASKGRKYSGVILGVLLIMFAVIDIHYFTHPTKLPFQEMSQYVNETREDGDFFINWDAGSHHLWETKYYGFNAPLYTPDGNELPYFVGTALMTEDDIIQKIPEGVDRVGIITSGSVEEIALPGFAQEEIKEIRGLKFMWYRIDSVQNEM